MRCCDCSTHDHDSFSQNWPESAQCLVKIGQMLARIRDKFGTIRLDFESKCADLGGDEEGDGDGEKEAALSENIGNYGQSMPKACPKDPQLWPEYGQNMARVWPNFPEFQSKYRTSPAGAAAAAVVRPPVQTTKTHRPS